MENILTSFPATGEPLRTERVDVIEDWRAGLGASVKGTPIEKLRFESGPAAFKPTEQAVTKDLTIRARRFR